MKVDPRQSDLFGSFTVEGEMDVYFEDTALLEHVRRSQQELNEEVARMVDNQHKKIKGYRDLTQREIDQINRIKQAEGEIRALLAEVDTLDLPSESRRRLEIAAINLETGFMYLVKAVARPQGQIGSAD